MIKMCRIQHALAYDFTPSKVIFYLLKSMSANLCIHNVFKILEIKEKFKEQQLSYQILLSIFV